MKCGRGWSAIDDVDVLGWLAPARGPGYLAVCKQEVTGSIPVGSIEEEPANQWLYGPHGALRLAFGGQGGALCA